MYFNAWSEYSARVVVRTTCNRYLGMLAHRLESALNFDFFWRAKVKSTLNPNSEKNNSDHKTLILFEKAQHNGACFF